MEQNEYNPKLNNYRSNEIKVPNSIYVYTSQFFIFKKIEFYSNFIFPIKSYFCRLTFKSSIVH